MGSCDPVTPYVILNVLVNLEFCPCHQMAVIGPLSVRSVPNLGTTVHLIDVLNGSLTGIVVRPI